ncbi:hypothetical protein F6R98_06570 [Candidatus Methylospira mobilis]|uniref:Uncharacterized protein n=1 Tax=Candidatus Methylospira mobilis TaxID=1808979 RepID=A0A5Q0BGR8_9GAMM|nr:hypothetical protein [Candidatus Methylospira mobilis]QFY42332.1 hypothetical protein F6R98_06570 [Candidatus Methylospira mobilis]
MNMKSFEKAVYRIRKERRDKGECEKVKATTDMSGGLTYHESDNKHAKQTDGARPRLGTTSKPKKFVHNPTPRDGILD